MGVSVQIALSDTAEGTMPVPGSQQALYTFLLLLLLLPLLFCCIIASVLWFHV